MATANAQWNYASLLRHEDKMSQKARPFEFRFGFVSASNSERDLIDELGFSAGLTYAIPLSGRHSIETGVLFQMKSYYSSDYNEFEYLYYRDEIFMLTYPAMYQYDLGVLGMSLRGGLETDIVLWGNNGSAGTNNPSYNSYALAFMTGVSVRTEELNFIVDTGIPVLHPMTDNRSSPNPFTAGRVSGNLLRATFGFRFGLQ